MSRRLWWAWCLGAVLAACGSVVVPVEPTPTPVPTPDQPPHDPTVGTITTAQFEAIGPSETEAGIRAALGAPFKEADAAGFHLLKYAVHGAPDLAVFWIKDGALDHKGILR